MFLAAAIPRNGEIKLSVNDSTIAPKAAAMIVPTAISKIDLSSINFLNSFQILNTFLEETLMNRCSDIRKFAVSNIVRFFKKDLINMNFR